MDWETPRFRFVSNVNLDQTLTFEYIIVTVTHECMGEYVQYLHVYKEVNQIHW